MMLEGDGPPIADTPRLYDLPVRFMLRMLWATRQYRNLARYVLRLVFRRAWLRRYRARHR